MNGILATVLHDLGQAQSFRLNWYGYATNQIGHAAVGFMVVGMVSSALFSVLGEFAPKEVNWLIVAGGYALFEVIQGGKNAWDSIQDWVFFSVYGAGSAVLLFTEITPGKPFLVTNINYIIPVGFIMSSHLAAGIIVRIVRECRHASR